MFSLTKEDHIERKGIICIAIGLIVQTCGGIVWARPTTPGQARQAVKGWLALDARPFSQDLGHEIDTIEPRSDDDGRIIYYIVRLHPGGYVIVSADDSVEPIVAFSDRDPPDRKLSEPMINMLARDLANRVISARNPKAATQSASPAKKNPRQKWDQLATQAEATDATASLMGVEALSDMRVPPLLSSTWGQRTACDNTCYNYYTPNNYRAGCVAIVMAQLMRYHQHPTAGIGRHTFAIEIDGIAASRNTRGGNGLGGSYNWSRMDLNPDCDTTLQQRQAIGSLCYDAGLTVNMRYDDVESISDTLDAADALTKTFGYANAVRGYNGGANIGAYLNAMINPNLDAKDPVIIGINGSGGHAAICDGYGYSSGTMYHHLNLGWSGTDNAWYNLPDIDAAHPYTSVYKCVYNVRVTPGGDGEIISGRILDQQGRPIPNPTVYALKKDSDDWITAQSDARGIYAFDGLESSSVYTIVPLIQGYVFNGRDIYAGTSADDSPVTGNVWGANFTAQLLEINAITPSSGPQNSYITIQGDGFGPIPGQVLFPGSRKAQIISWSNSEIHCRVPEAAVSGGVLVKAANLSYSTQLQFNVTIPGNLMVDPAKAIPNVQSGTIQYPFSTIQDGIDAASSGARVFVSMGVYRENIHFNGRDITVRSLLPNDPEYIAGTVIDATRAGPAVTFNQAEDANCLITGFTITGGSSDKGGAIACYYSSPTIRTCTIAANFASGEGGAMYCIGGSPTVELCDITGNIASNGGAIALENADATISECTFTANATTASGGAIHTSNGDASHIRNCTFVDNHAGNDGGAVAVNSCSALLTECSFESNSAIDQAGAVFNYLADSRLVNCAFTANTAGTDAGALANQGGAPNIINCTFTANTALRNGGAICNSNQSTPLIVNCTITANSAFGMTAGIFSASCIPTISNTIIWQNIDSFGANARSQLYGGTPVLAFSCIEGWTGSGYGIITDDPRFMCPPNDGGDGWGVGDNDFYGDLQLAHDSPCIDAANTAVLLNVAADGMPGADSAIWDIAANPRLLDTPQVTDHGASTTPVIDMGAHEFGAAVAHWKFDQSVGVMAVDSAATNNGVLSGGPLWQPVSGKFSGAMQFDGDNDYVSILNESNFDMVDAITVSAWININAIDKSWQSIIAKGDSAWRLSIYNQEPRIHFAVTGGPDYKQINSNSQLQSGIWHHICGVYDGRYLRIYIDGEQDPAAPVKHDDGIQTNDARVFIGENSEQLGRNFNGMIDDVRVYNYALDPQQIVALLCEYPSQADLNRDCSVNLLDFALMSNQWLNPNATSSADIAPTGGDGRVDSMDLATFSDNWLRGSQ